MPQLLYYKHFSKLEHKNVHVLLYNYSTQTQFNCYHKCTWVLKEIEHFHPMTIHAWLQNTKTPAWAQELM